MSTSKNVNGCPYKIVSDKVILSGRWLGYREVGFVDPRTNADAVWQCAFRTTTPSDSPVDGVDIIPVLKHKDGSMHFVFIKQYRIPVMGWTLEFPAGLIDANESVEEAAHREMKEETGYKITKVLIPPTEGKQIIDPGLSNDSAKFLTVEIDGSLPENENPVQDLKDTEVIEVILVPCANALKTLEKIVQSGVHVEAMVYSFVIGYTMGKNGTC